MTPMNIRVLEGNDALDLSTRPENHFFDRKSMDVKGGQIQKHAVAFANADGGEIAIGIEDEKREKDPAKRWRGAENIEGFNSIFQALHEVVPPLTYTATFLTSAGLPGYVLLLGIEKDALVHNTPDKTVYQRVSAQSLALTAEQAIQLGFAKGAASFEDQIVKAAKIEYVVESKEVYEFLSGYSPKTDPLDFVVNQHLVDINSWEPRTCGILLFADNPSPLMPTQCAIKLARYETREDDPERDHLKETALVEGPLRLQIVQAVKKLKEIMSAIPIWTLEGLKTVEYPPEAVWEVLTNAVIHRDYSISDHIHVHIFDNRIEILSPGKLPGYVTVENILDARYSRNPKIVRTLARYKDAPNKDMGEGLNTAFQKMKEWKLKSPEISVDGHYVKVVLPHTPLAAPEELVLEYVRKNGTIKNKEARDITGIRSENSMKNVFLRLQEQGEIEPVPGLKGSASRWQVKQK